MNISVAVVPAKPRTYAYFNNADGSQFCLEVQFWEFRRSELFSGIDAIVFRPSTGLCPANMIDGFDFIIED